MRSVAIALLAACAVSCAEEEPRFGPPGAIARQTFPGEAPRAGGGGDGGEVSFAPFPAPYDDATPPKDARKGADIHRGKAVIDATTDCATCHGPTPVAGAPSFAFAGLAFESAGSSAPLAFGEVVVHAGPTLFAIVKTTSDGYFAFPADRGPVPRDARTAVRDKNDAIVEMTAPLNGNGACNGAACHGGGAGRIDFKP
jgi:mono/diheme cytochrome c family protein